MNLGYDPHRYQLGHFLVVDLKGKRRGKVQELLNDRFHTVTVSTIDAIILPEIWRLETSHLWDSGAKICPGMGKML